MVHERQVEGRGQADEGGVGVEVLLADPRSREVKEIIVHHHWGETGALAGYREVKKVIINYPWRRTETLRGPREAKHVIMNGLQAGGEVKQVIIN